MAGADGAVFVGRQAELGELTRGLEDADRGRGRLFLIAGEPGIGKSRLAEGIAQRARDAGHVILSGRCWEAGGAPPYWPWVQSIRAYLRGLDPETLRSQLGDGGPDLAQLFPEIRVLLGGEIDPTALDQESSRFHLFDSLATFLGVASAHQTIVFLLDDLHAADTPSLLFLEFFTRSLGTMRILVIATYRDVELQGDHPLIPTLVEVARESATRRIVLSGLREPEVSTFIEATAGQRPSEALVEAVFRETEGNPLFVGEIVRLLASEGRLSSEEASSIKPIPQGIHDVIVRRVGHLSERCNHLLALASILGREFTLDVLSELSEQQPETVLENLDEAQRARLVSQTPGTLGGLRFSHGLIRDTLYEDLSAAQRVRLHRRAGEIIERLRGNDPDHVAEVALHHFMALPMGDAAKAIDHARRAAEAARARLAYEEAARFYSMALQAMQTGEVGDEGLRFDLLLARGDVLNRAGDAESAREEFLKAATIARRRNDAEGLAVATLGYGGQFQWTALRGDPNFVPMLESALDALGDVRSPLRVMLLGRLAAGPLRDDADARRRMDLSEQALTIARGLDDPATLGYALEARAGAIMGPDHIDELLTLMAETERVALMVGDEEKALMTHVWRMMVHLYRASMTEVSTERAEIGRLARRLRQGPQDWFLMCTDASLAFMAGRFDEAIRLSKAAYEAGRRAEPYALFAHRLQMLWVSKEQGRTREAQDMFSDSAERFAIFPVWRSMLPHLLLSFGSRDEARLALENALARPMPVNEEWTLGEGVLADAVADLGDVRAAEHLYAELVARADLTMGGIPDINMGSLRRPAGRLAALLGRLDEAEEHLRRAVEMNDRMGARPWASHARFDLAQMLLERDAPGDREAAESLLAEAIATARALGMRPLLAEAEALLSGRTLEQPSAQPVSGTSSVFRRDGEYYSVTYAGRSFRLRDTKGLRYIGILLGSPGREFHAVELASAVEGGSPEGSPAALTAGDDLLDAEARASYKRRLADLEEEIAEAEEFGDSERAGRARDEQEFVARELASAMGLGGRSRKTASDAERARVNVTRAIRSAMARIADNAPDLGKHLNATVSTGSFCSYTPDPRAAVAWRL